MNWFRKKRSASDPDLSSEAKPDPLPIKEELPFVDITGFGYSDTASAADHIKQEYGFEGDLAQLFSENDGPEVHKWHHYIPLYDRYFSRFRGSGVRFLEIGVSKGGSLQMWRNYLGSDAIIYGIDIDPECASLDGLHGEVRIGSQNDRPFLTSVIEEMGGVDVVLDDGSHQMSDIKASLTVLYPHLKTGGIYMIEDLHTAYWPFFGGGYDSEQNLFRLVGDLIDDVHHNYHDRGQNHPAISASVGGIHIHDSVLVLEKQNPLKPVHSVR